MLRRRLPINRFKRAVLPRRERPPLVHQRVPRARKQGGSYCQAKCSGVSLGSCIIYGILRLSMVVSPRDVIIRNMLTTVIPNTEEWDRTTTAAAVAAQSKEGESARLLPIRDACIIESRRWQPGRPTEGLTRECYFTMTRITRVADSSSFIRKRLPYLPLRCTTHIGSYPMIVPNAVL